MDALEHRVREVVLESERLYDYLSNLPDGAWKQQSACERWSIAAVVAHIISVADRHIGSITSGLQGDVVSSHGYPLQGGADSPGIGDVNADMAVAFSEELGDQLLPVFRSSYDQLNQLLTEIGPNDWDKPCYHPLGETSIRSFVTLRMGELALHGWDVKSALETEAHLSAESLPILMDWTMAASPRLVQPTTDAPGAACYRFHPYDVAHTAYDILVRNGAARMEPAGANKADIVIRCRSGDLPLLMSGRIDVESAVAEGRLALEHGSELPAGFGDWFKGVLPPSRA